jgi:hypothetical protein
VAEQSVAFWQWAVASVLLMFSIKLVGMVHDVGIAAGNSGRAGALPVDQRESISACHPIAMCVCSHV